MTEPILPLDPPTPPAGHSDALARDYDRLARELFDRSLKLADAAETGRPTTDDYRNRSALALALATASLAAQGLAASEWGKVKNGQP